MRPKRKREVELYNNFYLRGSLTDQQIKYIDKLLQMDKVYKLKDIIPRSAEVFKRDCDDIVLLDKQTIAVGLSFLNPYSFIGDKPGLGKTIMSAASYAQYRLKHMENGGKLMNMSKLLVVTDNNHTLGMEREYRQCGINLIPLYGGSAKIAKDLKNFNLLDPTVDGIVTSWDSLKVNSFLEFYMEYAWALRYGIWDETSTLKSTSTKLYPVADKMAASMDNGVFLNASPFETSIMDMWNQFAILNPTIIPTKKFVYDRYTVMGQDSWFVTEYVNTGGVYTPQRVRKTAYRLSDYKNQEELRQKLKYHYIARTKADYSDNLPDKIYRLCPVTMTGKMNKELGDSHHNYREILNSPATLNKANKITTTTVPKLAELVDLVQAIYAERPVIYVYNTEAQKAISTELKKLNLRVAIISGQLDGEYEETNSEDKFTVSEKDRLQILDDFKDGYYDVLVTNIKKAVSIYGSNAMVFYDIPTNPQITYQVMGRIDRNNYKDDKSYYFMVYMNSPEMQNIAELACFREEHSSKFTGQYEDVYKQLIKQIENYL